MQLRKIILLATILAGSYTLMAQTDKNSIDDKQNESQKKVKKSKTKLKDAEANFLLNYYEQDGDHSPVTGGRGTEKLENVAPTFVVHVPLDSVSNLDLNFGIDFYTSASTNNIDYFEGRKTGASGKDVRSHINAAYNRDLRNSGNAYSLMAGFSAEFDVTSFHFGGSYTINSKDQNRSLSLDALYMNDSWKLLYPYERRDGTNWLKDDKRTTMKFGLSYSQVINKRLQALFSAEVVSQSGLLSTPFHRVFFDDVNGVPDDNLRDFSHVEMLDDNRLKIPISMRLNYYLNDFMRLRTFYRFYTDSWGITAHTASIELPMQITPSLIASPFFRYHTQTAADYFYEFGQVSKAMVDAKETQFYTSDYDLSDLSSTKIGLGLQYSPLLGVGKFKPPFVKNKQVQLKSIGLRTAFYDRSDGLNAWLVSLDFAFTF
ncbi:uncharacterized protein DUF3570 [Ancylomarina subtilis]|uniref:Uncharacterized protein DUF3570 n=1 Tax=Ancylomarina subtilis TaxID=1639035 RepID=A0A4Q7V988_9BACT|nr:DUF3570 domain-containing protein [Ancylomarina subtilis]RZT91853.1 uncharacterized protein DUF3570 [Ancylomarina subtilis]